MGVHEHPRVRSWGYTNFHVFGRGGTRTSTCSVVGVHEHPRVRSWGYTNIHVFGRGGTRTSTCSVVGVHEHPPRSIRNSSELFSLRHYFWGEYDSLCASSVTVIDRLLPASLMRQVHKKGCCSSAWGPYINVRHVQGVSVRVNVTARYVGWGVALY